jgi:hypothetical protein
MWNSAPITREILYSYLPYFEAPDETELALFDPPLLAGPTGTEPPLAGPARTEPPPAGPAGTEPPLAGPVRTESQ